MHDNTLLSTHALLPYSPNKLKENITIKYTIINNVPPIKLHQAPFLFFLSTLYTPTIIKNPVSKKTINKLTMSRIPSSIKFAPYNPGMSQVNNFHKNSDIGTR